MYPQEHHANLLLIQPSIPDYHLTQTIQFKVAILMEEDRVVRSFHFREWNFFPPYACETALLAAATSIRIEVFSWKGNQEWVKG